MSLIIAAVTSAVVLSCSTDIYMFVIDGFSNKIITDVTYHTLDIDFILIRRHTHNVVGITVCDMLHALSYFVLLAMLSEYWIFLCCFAAAIWRQHVFCKYCIFLETGFVDICERIFTIRN